MVRKLTYLWFEHHEFIQGHKSFNFIKFFIHIEPSGEPSEPSGTVLNGSLRTTFLYYLFHLSIDFLPPRSNKLWDIDKDDKISDQKLLDLFTDLLGCRIVTELSKKKMEVFILKLMHTTKSNVRQLTRVTGISSYLIRSVK